MKKIKNIKISESIETKDKKVLDVKSVRNRLLQNSDWVFTEDVSMDDVSKKQWANWRQRVRDVLEEANSLEEALDILDKLDNDKPNKVYLYDRPDNIELYKIRLNKRLHKKISEFSEKIYEKFGLREIMIEKYYELTRYFENPKTENILFIKTEMEINNVSKEIAVERLMEERKNYLLILYKIDNLRKSYLKLIDSVESLEDCDTISNKINELSLKKWILI